MDANELQTEETISFHHEFVLRNGIFPQTRVRVWAVGAGRCLRGTLALSCRSWTAPLLLLHLFQVLFFKGVNLRRLLLFQAFIAFIAQTLSEEIDFLVKLKQNLNFMFA